MTAHKHAALMLQYAQDAMETDKPWERWECNDGVAWRPFTMKHPSWLQECEYRRKPRTLTYTVTIPEPLMEAPEVGTIVYLPTPLDEELATMYGWYGIPQEYRLLKRGLCFATKEDAIAAAKAMLPIKEEA